MSTSLIRPAWSPLMIFLMVAGFIFFWPLGLAILFYIIWGEKTGRNYQSASAWFEDGKDAVSKKFKPSSGNSAFDEYRNQELRRLDEERRKLDEERFAFIEYMEKLKRAKDREEFDQFMNSRSDIVSETAEHTEVKDGKADDDKTS